VLNQGRVPRARNTGRQAVWACTVPRPPGGRVRLHAIHRHLLQLPLGVLIHRADAHRADPLALHVAPSQGDSVRMASIILDVMCPIMLFLILC